MVPAARATTVAATAETMRFVLSTEPIIAACRGVFCTYNCSKCCLMACKKKGDFKQLEIPAYEEPGPSVKRDIFFAGDK